MQLCPCSVSSRALSTCHEQHRTAGSLRTHRRAAVQSGTASVPFRKQSIPLSHGQVGTQAQVHERPQAAATPLSKAWDAAASAEGQTRADRFAGGMFTPRRQYNTNIPQIDHMARRRAREVGEIAEAAQRVGVSRAQVDDGIMKLESLLPDLSPNLEKMKASHWVVLIRDVNSVAQAIIILKTYYPKANISKVVSRSPKILLQLSKQIEDDAIEVQQLVAGRLPDLDAIIEVVPDLLKPAQMRLSLSNLKRWLDKDPFEMLQRNPNMLREIEEADLDADPTYDWVST